MDLSTLIAETPDGVMGIGHDGRVLYANRAAARMLRRPSGLAGRPFEELVAQGSALLLASRVDAGTRCVTLVRGDDTRAPAEATIAAHGEGSRLFYSTIVRERAASDRADLVRALAAEREAFLAAVAHELRAPVQPVIASLRTLERAAAMGIPAPPDTLPRALRQALRLGRLVNTTLRDLGSERRTPPVEFELEVMPFDVAALVDDIVEDFRQAAPERVITLSGPTAGVTLGSDRDRVNRIVLTLIDNALKYSPKDRAVDVELGASPTEVHIRVIDRGVGIPEAEQASIFGKFYRASNIAEGTSGLGMGLYLAWGLAERLRGRLSVASKEGEGSTFSLVLPRTWPAASAIEVAPVPAQGDVGNG